MSRDRKILSAHGCLFGGFALATIYWFIEAIIHSTIFHGRDISSHLLPLDDANELCMRVVVAGMFVVFGIVMDIVLARLRHSHQYQGRLVELLEQRTHDLSERVKELGCLFGIDELARKEEATIEEILGGTVMLIPPSWQYPHITESRITYEGKEFATKTFKKTRWRQSADIVIDNKPAGSIEVCYTKAMPKRHEGPFVEEERKLIDSIATRLSGIIKRKRAEQALRESEARFQQLSKTDVLTGLLNRRGWNECLNYEERRAQRHGHLSCVIIADLDGLKDINDRYGHATGDDLIRRSADCIRGAVRRIDKVARIGGDEFAVLALECGEDTADNIAKRIEDAWSAEGIQVSWGIAMRNPDSGLQGAMAEADHRMYEMKAERRSRTSRTCDD